MMRLVHFVSAEEDSRIFGILKKGILPQSMTGEKEWSCGCSELRDEISLLAMPEGSENYAVTWGDCNFVLSEEFVRANAHMLKSNVGNFGGFRGFKEFLKETGIEPYKGIFPDAYSQVLALQPIPIAGIERLVVPDDREFADKAYRRKPKHVGLFLRVNDIKVVEYTPKDFTA